MAFAPHPPPGVVGNTTVPRARRGEGDRGRDFLHSVRSDALAGLRDQVLAAGLNDALERRRRARLRNRLARLRRARLGEDRRERRRAARPVARADRKEPTPLLRLARPCPSSTCMSGCVSTDTSTKRCGGHDVGFEREDA